MNTDMNCRVAQASKAFSALRKAVFQDKDLRLVTKKRIYNACIFSVLLFGAECWTPLRQNERNINTFHHRCIRTILDISNREQWSEPITTAEVRRRWGHEETVGEKVQRRQLERSGHLGGILSLVHQTLENAQPQSAKGHVVRLAVTTPTPVCTTEEMEGHGRKGPQGCGSGKT